jgi:hypothetical protein
MKMREIAEIIGISKQRVGYILHYGIEMIGYTRVNTVSARDTCAKVK